MPTTSISYSEKLKDPRWQKKRLEILSRDEFTCVCCGDSTKTLHVHHSEYTWGKDPWDYPNDKLETLCVDCHEATTQIDNDLKDAKKQLIAAWESWTMYHQLMLPSLLKGWDTGQAIEEYLTGKQDSHSGEASDGTIPD